MSSDPDFPHITDDWLPPDMATGAQLWGKCMRHFSISTNNAGYFRESPRILLNEAEIHQTYLSLRQSVDWYSREPQRSTYWYLHQ